MTLYFVITHEQEDMVIEFNYALDLSDPLEAQWVDQDNGQIVIQRMTKVSFFDSVNTIKKQDCRIDVNLYNKNHDHGQSHLTLTSTGMGYETCLPKPAYSLDLVEDEIG